MLVVPNLFTFNLFVMHFNDLRIIYLFLFLPISSSIYCGWYLVTLKSECKLVRAQNLPTGLP